MADHSEVTTIQLTDKEYSDKPISIFWLGEFGHFIMFVVPHINALRLMHPNRKITVASYEGDHIYLRNNKGEWSIDEYISFPWWEASRGCHQCKTQVSEPAKEALNRLKGIIMETNMFSLKQYSQIFKDNHRLAYPFKDILGDELKIDDGSHCVIFSRSDNFGHTQRSWNTKSWHEFMEMLLDEHSGKIYICGISKQSIHFNYNDRVINMLDVPNRSQQTLNLLSNAKYCISDCSGSANYAILVGTPTFVSGPKVFRATFVEPIRGRNYFGTYVLYQSIEDLQTLTASHRMEAFREFLGSYTSQLQKTRFYSVPSDA